MIHKTDYNEFQSYLTDASNFKGHSDDLFIPENKEEIYQIIEICNKKNQKLTISGGRTGLTGSAVPLEGAILSTENLKIFKYLGDNLFYCEPGIINRDFNQILFEQGFFFPSNPTETSSTLGGNIATNASAARTFKYGATRNFISRLNLILSDGDSIDIQRGEIKANDFEFDFKTLNGRKINFNFPKINLPDLKHAAGYYLNQNMDLIDLIIGSEGTLGVVSDFDLKVVNLPDNLLGLIVYFDDPDKMLSYVDNIRELSIQSFKGDFNIFESRLIEYFDNNSLNVLRKYYSLPEKAKSAIWIEAEYLEINDEIILSWLEKIKTYTNLADETWVALDDKEHRKMAEFRHKLPSEVYENLTSHNMQKLGTDTAIPKPKFKNYYKWIYKNLDDLGIEYLVFGHIGNCHLHINLFYNNEKEKIHAYQFYDNLIDLTLKLGGTVSAEHGIGKLKKPYLKKMFGEKIWEMKKIKDIFDPINMFGNGNLF